jgi:methylenetetrahydrofolate dehydrogenase (NADP+)/methenyltetrahydrofolate cyclohydrolase
MIIDGKKIAEEALEKIKQAVTEKELKLRLGAVLVGDDPEFKKFVELKSRAAEKAGIDFTIYKFPEEIDTEELIKNMRDIVEWSDGVLVELPLPKHVDQQAVLNEVPAGKDVDVLSDETQRSFYDNKSLINPPAVEALRTVFENQNIDPEGKKVAVFGFGVLIGKPVAHWLTAQGADVSVIRSKTTNPGELSLKADIIISGVGKPDLINGDMVKEGVIVVDFGYGKLGGKMTGDVDFKTVSPKAGLITPVPGGMGPVLIVAVLKNLIKLNS